MYKCLNCSYVFANPRVEEDSITYSAEYTHYFTTDSCPECHSGDFIDLPLGDDDDE
jgi:rubredoxin